MTHMVFQGIQDCYMFKYSGTQGLSLSISIKLNLAYETL